ncbi:calcium-activated potassium channel subunit beta-4 isoform X2 [Vulpes lagopus]|uniref:calcium-activated potassium channel subunit beta-4 isoform X2 n=1 Tax=Vulpes lagopus TaxID=494514 RepID=UPI000FC7B44E|nr:calcium-activated potassium channel subunit beta-4 isoform X2 [Vulpes lagopus]
MAKLRVAYEYTEAEDKSIRLGLFLIISGVVSLFIFGFCWLSPALQDLQATAANCTVLSVQQLGELFECTFTCGADCRGTALYPCVQVYVNNSESHSRALLHSDEHQLLANPKCSYIPPCKRENQKNLENVMNWQQYWKDEIGSQPFTCYFNQFQSHIRGSDEGSIASLGRSADLVPSPCLQQQDQTMCSCTARMMRLSSCIASSGPW